MTNSTEAHLMVSSSTGSASPKRSIHIHPAVWMVVLGLLLRVSMIFVYLPDDYAKILQNRYWFGFEAGRIGQSISQGRGFSSPFPAETGPTAWLAPVYPTVIAAVFTLVKPYTPAALFLMLFFNSIFSALTCLFIVPIGEKIGGRNVALTAGWLWALAPYFSKWPVGWIWEISLSGFLVAALVWLSMRLYEQDRKRLWVVFGLVCGLGALTNPTTLAIIPALAIFPLWKKASWMHAIRRLALAAVISATLIAPWMVRNYQVFGKPVFIRSNFWFEFYLGNSFMESGTNESWRHPSGNNDELLLYARLGELEYVQYSKQRALSWVQNHPLAFLRTTGKRVFYYWMRTPDDMALYEMRYSTPFHPYNLAPLLLSIMGIMGALLAWKRRVHIAIPAIIPLIFYPVVYYLTYPGERYRHPLEPLLLIFSIYLLSQAEWPAWLRFPGAKFAPASAP